MKLQEILRTIDKIFSYTHIIFFVYFMIFFAPNSLLAQAKSYRTPGYKRVVIFSPCAFDIRDISAICDSVARWRGYQVTSYVQDVNPTTSPRVTLLDFIGEIGYHDIGLLYISTYGEPDKLALEFYEDTRYGKEARDATYYWYTHLPSYPIDSSFIVKTHSEIAGYSISLNKDGIRHYNSRLKNTIVFVDASYSAQLNNCWNSLCALGFNTDIVGLGNTDEFFLRIGGLGSRDTTNLGMEIGDAAKGIYYLTAKGDTSWLELLRNPNQDKVTFSSIVTERYPESLGISQPGAWGWLYSNHLTDTPIVHHPISFSP
jgi:hypothetical protein